MSEQFIAKDALSRWLTELSATHTVIAPVRRGDQVVFRPVANVSEIAWDAGRTDFSAKDFFLPASEAIVTWRPSEAGIAVETAQLGRPQVLFGARPCDAQALDVLADASAGFSGAELEQAVVAAVYSAHAEHTNVTAALIAKELAATRPLAVVMAEQVESLRQWASERTVAAG